MPATSISYLIAAVSGRALAQSARRGGHAVGVVDDFADQDTVAAAVATRPANQPGSLRFHAATLLRSARELAPPGDDIGVVYGSGFEGRPRLLERLAAHRPLLGNTPDVVRLLRNPASFFPLLERLQLPTPERALTRPAQDAGWLVKHPGGAGGVQVHPLDRRPPTRGSYYQRQMSGVPYSVLFLADGVRAHLVGFNQQWTAPQPARPFLYGGAVSRATVPRACAAAMPGALDALVRATGLRGLNGMDFLLDGEQWWILEVNPRPTATMELYDPDVPGGLFDAHLRACRGELPAGPAHGPSRAGLVVHATLPWTVPDTFAFPPWCHDLPWPGTAHAPGDPICTITAEAATPVAVRTQLERRFRDFQRLLRD